MTRCYSKMTLALLRFRLTRLATSAHVSDILLNASGPLASLHQRVLEAGCQVDPEWKLGKIRGVGYLKKYVEVFGSLTLEGPRKHLNKIDVFFLFCGVFSTIPWTSGGNTV